MKKTGILVWVLLLLTTISGVAVSTVRHESRKTFVELQKLQKERDTLNVEWGQLQIELASKADAGKVRELARNRLAMKAPVDEGVVVIR